MRKSPNLNIDIPEQTDLYDVDKFGAWFDMVDSGLPLSNMARQAIINGNFDIWQRGTSFINPNGFTADRYVHYFSADGGTAPTITVSKQALPGGAIIGSSNYLNINVNGAGGSLGDASFAQVQHSIENGVRNLCGTNKKVTVSFWAKSTIAGKKIGIWLLQRYGTGGSPSSQEAIYGRFWTLTNTWTKYTYTFTTNTLSGKTFGTNNDDNLLLSFIYQWGNANKVLANDTAAESFVGAGDISIAQVQVSAGDVDLPFQPKSIGEELRACMRYYQPMPVWGGRLESYAPNALYFYYSFPIAMRKAPTLITTGVVEGTDYAVKNVNSGTLSGFSTFSYASIVNTGVELLLGKTAHGVTDAFMYSFGTGKIAFDAEL